MIVYFPTPFNEELLYSIIARYHKWTGEFSVHTVLQELFGVRNLVATIDLPSRIGYLVNQLPINSHLTADKFVREHTLFPFYSAFLSPEQAEAVYRSMVKGDGGGDIYMRTGLMASKIRYNRFFRYCPVCAKEDLEDNYGEMVWYRMFQIPGLDICVKHGVWLLDSTVMLRQEKRHIFVAPDEENCPLEFVSVVKDSKIMEQYRFLHNGIERLLRENFPNRSFDWFESCYLSKLQEKGYATIYGGYVNQERLRRDFKEHFGTELLERLQSTVDEGNSWLTEITRKHRKSFHPIRHLLLTNFLGISLKELFYQETSYLPFGSGPWHCLNPAAEHYLQKAITNITLTTYERTKKIIGTFSCSCGFVYTRRVGEDDEPFKKSRVKRFGEAWERECKRLAAEGFGLREIGRRLQADPITVKKCLKNGMEKSGKGRKNEQIEQRAIDRMNWLQLQEEHPELPKTELRKLNPDLFTRLYRNDRSWLEKNSPVLKKMTIQKGWLDWSQRDKEILLRVQSAVDEILNAHGKPQRVTISKVGAICGAKALLEKHLDRLPETKIYLNCFLETDEQFRLRKIKWAIHELKQEGQETSVWRILRKASIRNEHCPTDIEELIRIQDFSYVKSKEI
ncbi:TnsD family transposase [Brevibacillus agri]|uniref:TnsD family transposase n=1 Tax=Brevibacillus agri TaxID=51101 RepID=UPI001EE5AC85|nr:TnsD family transposase [Brevibacillus agri]MCG5252495.1 TnsD family transposase [Brevibacillus agri]